MKRASLLLVVVVLSPLVVSGCSPETQQSFKESTAVTLDEAIETAKQELDRVGYDVEDMKFGGDEKNTEWRKHISVEPAVLDGEIVKSMHLTEKSYWAIRCSPKELMLGGGAWVFVDKQDGKLIGVLRGR